jgi:heterotetrameric sarcosine oxidase beta subunit
VAVPGTFRGRLGGSYDVVIVGAGIQGLALAYELAKLRAGRIAVLEARHPGVGASGRNGELIRSAFSTREWTQLFDISLRKWYGLNAELDANILFSHPGYLVLAAGEMQLQGLRRDAETQRELGLDTEILDHDQIRKLIPALAPEQAYGGLIQPAGGFAHHDATIWAYAAAAARLGVEIHCDTLVTGVDTEHDRVTGVQTNRGHVFTPLVVNAAGGFANELASMAGVELASTRCRLEMIVTESVQPFLKPALAALELFGYCHQTGRGEFVGGTEFKDDPADTVNVTLAGLRDIATKFVRLFPQLAGVRLIRHWAGLVDQTADHSPVIGAAPELDGFYLNCGWTYGFMGAPGTAELLARTIVSGSVDPLIAPFGIERLRSGDLIREGSLVLPKADPAKTPRELV